MKRRYGWIGLLAGMLLWLPAAQAQYVRWDWVASTTTGAGQAVPLLALPGAAITFYSCTGSSCGTLATTYNASNGGACSTTTQVVLPGSTQCVATADAQGNFGGWFASGQYAYSIYALGRTFGPFPFTIGGGSIGTGVTSLNALTGALNIAVGSGLSVTASGNTITISLSTPFTINSFSGCSGTVELGTSITNPAFSATYSVTPASANITNTDNIDSPLNLTTPFTSGTVVGTFSHSSVTTTTFTLTAVQGSTQTATCTDTWQPAIFAGLGAAGATSSVTASGTTAVLSTSDVLARDQLGAETVGQTFGPYAPAGQVVYLLLTGGSHTFTDQCTGFPFAFNAPLTVSFVNVHGVTVPLFLYASTNPLTGPCFEPKVAS